jgi:flavin-dependent dehydrogenase
VLLGDAAGFVDPITGGGMTQALMSAELLDRHLPDSLSNPEDGLLQFERARHRMLRDYRMITGALLWVAQYPALAQRIFSILGARPKLFSHLIGIPAGVRGLFGNATAGS